MRAHLVGVDFSANAGPTVVGFLGGFRVTLNMGGFELDSSVTHDSDGTFEFTHYHQHPPRILTLIVRDAAGREIRFAGGRHVSPRFKLEESGRVSFEDVEDEQIIEGDFFVNIREAQGFLVTLGTGETPVTLAPGEVPAPGGPTVASGWGLSHGNAVTILTDHEVFQHAAALMRSTKGTPTQKGSLFVTQLTFSIPDRFQIDPAKEPPRAVFAFDPPPPALSNLPRPASVKDARPERLLIEAADRNVDVRVILNAVSLPLFLKILLGVIIFPFAGSDGVFATGGIVDRFTSADEVRRYFSAARPAIRVQEFVQPLLNVGIMHARLAIFDGVDGLQAICMGASFTQSYIDTQDHAIDEPRRGGATGLPNHDAGIAIVGPAIGDLHRNVQLLWNNTEAPDAMPTLPRNPPPQTSGGDGRCSIQIVRTLTEDRFANFEKGEKGCLEAYLRAIANAQDYIYLENQYFIDKRIGSALVNVMKLRPKLQVIMVLNINPDVWYLLYPLRQRRLITRIRRAIGETPDNPRQFAVFTRWTHENAPQNAPPRPRIMPVYIHAKVGIVDDKWATVGSANLDYASMDRAYEVNAVLLNGVDGEPHSDVIAILRRKLWAEHLGFVNAQGALDLNAPALLTRPTPGWLELWRTRAADTLQRLKTQPSLSTSGMARVLPWPKDNNTHKEPRDYITALDIKSHAVAPIKGTRAFDFQKGNYAPGSKAVMDFD